MDLYLKFIFCRNSDPNNNPGKKIMFCGNIPPGYGLRQKNNVGNSGSARRVVRMLVRSNSKIFINKMVVNEERVVVDCKTDRLNMTEMMA